MAEKESVYVEYDGTDTKTKMLVDALNHNTKDTLHDAISINRQYEDPLEGDINMNVLEGFSLTFDRSNYHTNGMIGDPAFIQTDYGITVYAAKEAIEHVDDSYIYPRKYISFDMGMSGIPFTGYYTIEFDLYFRNPQLFEKNRNKMLGVMIYGYVPFVNGTPTSMQPGSVPRTNIVLNELEVFGNYYKDKTFTYYPGTGGNVASVVYSYQSFDRNVEADTTKHYSFEVKLYKGSKVPNFIIVMDDFIEGYEYSPLSTKSVFFVLRNITTKFLNGKDYEMSGVEYFYKDKWHAMRNPGADVFSGQQVPDADVGNNGDVFFELGEPYPYIDSAEKLSELTPIADIDRYTASIYGNIYVYNEDKTYNPNNKKVSFSYSGYNLRDKMEYVEVFSGPGYVIINDTVFAEIEVTGLPVQTEIQVSFDMQLSVSPQFDTRNAIIARYPETVFYPTFNDTYLDLYYTQGMRVHDTLGGYDSVISASSASITFSANTNVSNTEKITIDLSSISNYIYKPDYGPYGEGNEGYNSLEDLNEKVPPLDARTDVVYLVKGEQQGELIPYYWGQYSSYTFTTVPDPNRKYTLTISNFNIEYIRTYENILYKHNNTWLSEDESSGGTTVVANPSGTATSDLNKLQVGQDIYSVGGTTVVANPSGTASTDLEKIQVGPTIYSIPSGGSGSVNDILLDGVSAIDQYGNANINSMVGASSSTSGTKGLVPTPTAGDNIKFLSGDGRWEKPYLPALDGVYIRMPKNGQVLRYNLRTTKWENSDDTTVLIGTSMPTNDIGVDGDLYYQYHESTTEWTADSEYIVTDAETVFDICGERSYSKTNSGKAIAINYVSSSWSGGMLISRDPLACYYSNQGGSVTTTNSTVIDGVTWYISTPGGWITGAHYNTNDVAQDIEFDFSTQSPNDPSIIVPIILEAANERPAIDGIVATYLKKDGVWVADNSGGTTVVANPSDTPTDALSSIRIGGSVYSVSGGGSTITVNPLLSEGTPIATITINGTEYTLYAPEGGSGGGGEEMPEIISYTEINKIKNKSGAYIGGIADFEEYELISDPADND